MSESHPQNRPVIFLAISPRFIDDWGNLQRALSILSQQDQGMRIATEPTERRVIISGMGETHLEVICDCLAHEFNIPLDVGKPKVIYLETIRKNSDGEAKYIRQVGGRGQYAHVKLRLEPLEQGSGYQFINETSKGAVPREFVEPVDSGIQEAMNAGISTGYEMADLRAVLYDGSYHVEDSNEMAFKIAASMAFKQAARKASPVVLEPVMSLEVVTPEDCAGSIMGDLSLRRGRIEGMEQRADSQVIHAIVPLSEMFGYAAHLRSITRGQTAYSLHFARYEAAPRGGESGADEIGVTANKPEGPRSRSGSAAANLDAEPE
jgi:elongation factor G